MKPFQYHPHEQDGVLTVAIYGSILRQMSIELYSAFAPDHLGNCHDEVNNIPMPGNQISALHAVETYQYSWQLQ